ncbi:MAG: hypothetical protein U9Q35_00980 [Pseudomonadota bacterium]|nr:hypothetical protein [Pseudomonadota bacterium]
MTDDPDYIICYVQGLFEYRRVAEWRIMQDHDFKLRKKPIPELSPGEVLTVVPGQSLYRIIKHE